MVDCNEDTSGEDEILGTFTMFRYAYGNFRIKVRCMFNSYGMPFVAEPIAYLLAAGNPVVDNSQS